MKINNMTKIVEELKENSKRWTAYGKDRLYLEWKTIIGLDIQYYKTGNISSATLQGISISNSKATQYLSGKAYIDMQKNQLVCDEWMDKDMILLLQETIQSLDF